MYPGISVGWWRRWAWWSLAWVLGWLLLLFAMADGPTFSPGGNLSNILAFVFGMPILAPIVRWCLPRVSHWAAHTFKAERRDPKTPFENRLTKG